MRYLPSLLIALAILAAPVVWHVSQTHLAPPPPPDATISFEAELALLRAEVRALSDRVDGLDARTALGLQTEDRQFDPATPNPTASDSLRDAFAQVVLIANRRKANEGLTVASPRFLKELFGLPREDLTDDCQPATNPKIKELLSLEEVGPIRVRMMRPAVVSIRQVFANVQVFEPELYKRIKSAGSLCVRRIRGSENSASSHAYGLAVDINIDGVLDSLADGKTQLGLTLLADFFKKEGWIWGAGFGREDSMHFEVSREKLTQWRRLGLI
ncbi:MAG: M15 family metallopeptidase [Pseudomonadota bacterium]